jgi:hypothetical protein
VTTTIHIPDALLELVDRRARVLGTSRNRVIVDAIAVSLGSNETWPPELVSMLSQPLDRRAADELEATLGAVQARRGNRKRTPKL